MNLTPENLRWVFIYMITLIVSVALHEWGHAFMADKLGDDTPRRQGRVTLNPIAHADLWGTLVIPLFFCVVNAASGSGRIGGFGWGRPVQWNPSRVKRKWKMWQASILVSIAGPVMNLVLGTVLVFVAVLLKAKHLVADTSPIHQIVWFAAGMNYTLFFFNLVPCPPLDGGHVAEALTPYKHRRKWEEYLRYSPFVFLGLICIPQVARIFLIPAAWCRDHIANVFIALLT
jgi:Zn-dependent protease